MVSRSAKAVAARAAARAALLAQDETLLGWVAVALAPAALNVRWPPRAVEATQISAWHQCLRPAGEQGACDPCQTRLSALVWTVKKMGWSWCVGSEGFGWCLECPDPRCAGLGSNLSVISFSRKAMFSCSYMLALPAASVPGRHSNLHQLLTQIGMLTMGAQSSTSADACPR